MTSARRTKKISDRRLLYLLGSASIAGGIAYFRAKRKVASKPSLDGILAAVQEATQSQLAVEALPLELRTLLSHAGDEVSRYLSLPIPAVDPALGPTKDVLVRDAEFEVIPEKRKR